MYRLIGAGLGICMICGQAFEPGGAAALPAAAESHGPALPDNLPPGYFVPEKNTRFIDLFFDDETGDLDMSELLALGGFIPVPIPITQPVVGGGLGLAAVFLKPDTGAGHDPRQSAIAYVRTGNDSEGVFAFQSGSDGAGRLKYNVEIGAGRLNLDFFPNGSSEKSFGFTNEAVFFEGRARYRLGGSDGKWFIGPRFRIIDTEVKPNTSDLPTEFVQRVRLNALGLSLHFDDRDNILTPTDGINANLKIHDYNDAWRSDANFTRAEGFNAYFQPITEDWSFAINAVGEVT